jgi:hypothetical protein
MSNNDILAVNNLLLCKSDFIEFEKAIRKRTVKVAFAIVIICVTIIYAAAIVSALQKIHIVSGALLILMAFCLIISIFIYVVYPHWLGGIRYKQYCMTHNSTGRMIFYWDRLGTMVGVETVQTLLYTDIKKVVQTDNLFIMEFSNKVYAIVRRDGFSEGSLEAVQDRLSNKLK